MLKLLRSIWAIYATIVFFVLWIILSPFLLISFLLLPKSAYRQIIWVLHHGYTRVYFALILVRVNIKNRQLLNKNQSYIIVSNHVSPLDFMANAMAFPRAYKYLAKKELIKIPVFGYIVKRLCVLVDRKNVESRRKSISYLEKTLEEGYSVFVYPEGTRNKSNQPIQPFYKGAFRLAVQTQTPIAVQTITDIKNIIPQERFGLQPGQINIRWSEPILTNEYQIGDVPIVMKKTKEQMLVCLEVSI